MLKVDDKEVFIIQSHKSVLIEKTIGGLYFPDEVPVYRDFDYRDLIGIAKLRRVKRKVFADFSLFIDILGYPAIAYIQKGENNFIYAVAISSKPNADKDIQPISK